MAKTKFRKSRIHTAICDTCKGNGYTTLPDEEDPREKNVHQCWDCDSEGEVYVHEPEMVSSSNDDNDSDTNDNTMH